MPRETTTKDPSRRTVFIGAIEQMLTAYDEWYADHDADTIAIDSPFDLAIQVVIARCNNGSIPADCREMATAAGQLELEYGKYRDGHKDSKGAPGGSFFAAIARLQTAHIGIMLAAVPKNRNIEPVAELIASNVSFQQIALIYGMTDHATGKKIGPFFDDFGRVLEILIRQEAKEPGSVIPAGWVHPQDEFNSAQLADQARGTQRRLEQIREQDVVNAKRREAIKYRPTEQEVVDFLMEGAFIHQVVSTWPVLEEGSVVAIANRAGIALSTIGIGYTAQKLQLTVDGVRALGQSAKLDEQLSELVSPLNDDGDEAGEAVTANDPSKPQRKKPGRKPKLKPLAADATGDTESGDPTPPAGSDKIIGPTKPTITLVKEFIAADPDNIKLGAPKIAKRLAAEHGRPDITTSDVANVLGAM